ncbi:MAG: 50S ribosomal protein L10 [Buchnera aphidicola (Nurudea shiraii)]
MILNLQKKKEIVTEIHNTAKNALSIVIANSRNVKVNEITELRKLARKIGVKLGVFKNTLIKLGIKGTHFSCLKKLLVGPVLIGYSIDHPRSAAKLFKEFSTKNKNFKIIGAVFEGQILSQSNINILSDMLTYNEAIYKLIITIKEITIGKLIRALISIKETKHKI